MRRWLVVTLAAVALTLLLGGFKVWQIRAAIAFGESFPEQTETVEAVVVRELSWTPNVSAVGQVVAPSSVMLQNELPGRVVEVAFAAGDAVEKGQVLVRLDSRQEQAELAAARARAQLARTQLERAQQLLGRSATSQGEVDVAQASLSVAMADAAALEAIIDKQTLRAPFAARTGLHTLEVGEYLAANTTITQLVGVDDLLWIDFELPQQQTGLEVGTRVSVTAPGLLDEPAEATLIARGAALSDTSRSRAFRASLSGQSERLVPGAIVRVGVPMGEPTSVAVLPATAVRHSGFSAQAYVIVSRQEDNEEVLRAELRTVTLGDQRDQQVVILEGVKVGERVAATGAFKLRDGMRLRVEPAADAAASAEQP